MPLATAPTSPVVDEGVRALVRRAQLAPSSHNTEPWRFRIVSGGLELVADHGRWLPVTDADRRELYLGLGCALENLLVAAEHFGYAHDTVLFPHEDSDDVVAAVRLRPGGWPSLHRPAGLFRAIEARHTHRGRYDADPPSPATLGVLAASVVEAGVGIRFLTEAEERAAVAEWVRYADELLFASAGYRRELAHSIAGGALGDPWPLSRITATTVARFDVGRRVARRDRAAVEAGPTLGLITAEPDTPRSQVAAGQALERVWLRATDLGLRLQPMSAPLQVPEGRRSLSTAFAGGRPLQHLFRMGYAPPPRRRSARRPLEEVLEA